MKRVISLTPAILLLVCQCVTAQTTGSHKWGGTHSETTGGSWLVSQECESIKDYSTRPKTIADYSVSFALPTLDKLGNYCTISGTLNYEVKVTNERLPINWFQGVSIYLLREPEDIVDWSTGVDTDMTEHERVILKNDGSFDVTFDMRETGRNPIRAQDFQVAIALADHKLKEDREKQTVVWKSSQPAIPETVQMISIPASLGISRELRLIDQACNWPFHDPDATKLIRAVNALQPLGKKKALAILKEYAELADESMSDDHEIVFWIIRLLFEPVDLKKRIPSPAIAVVILNKNRKDNDVNWPLGPLELVDGIPFMIGEQIGSSGIPEHPFSHIQWVEQYGVIRDSPINPSGNPLLAAERLMATDKFAEVRAVWDESKITSIREQAFKTLGIPIPEDEYEWPTLTEEVWKDALQSDQTRYRWHADNQTFEMQKPAAK